jgi:hypothetical protein
MFWKIDRIFFGMEHHQIELMAIEVGWYSAITLWNVLLSQVSRSSNATTD